MWKSHLLFGRFEDSNILFREFNPEFLKDDLQHLPKHMHSLKLSVADSTSSLFSAEMIPPFLAGPLLPERRSSIRRVSDITLRSD
jgi:hypothetical protein